MTLMNWETALPHGNQCLSIYFSKRNKVTKWINLGFSDDQFD
jgi:hypothetical protein